MLIRADDEATAQMVDEIVGLGTTRHERRPDRVRFDNGPYDRPARGIDDSSEKECLRLQFDLQLLLPWCAPSGTNLKADA